MRSRVLLMSLALLGAVGVWATDSPVAVSPGEHSKPALIADACPTFSWSAVPGAVAYEIVVYSTDVPQLLGEAIDPVLRHRVQGAATSWTPPLGRCLEIGQSYAWLVRVPDASGDGDWSEARLFEVAGAPTPQRVREALAVLRSWLGTQGLDANGPGGWSVDSDLTKVSGRRLPDIGAAPETRKATATRPTVSAVPVAGEAALFAQASVDDLGDDIFDIELGGSGEIFSDTSLNLYSNSNVFIDLDNDNNEDNYLNIYSGTDTAVFTFSEGGDLQCAGSVGAQGLELARLNSEPYVCHATTRGGIIYVRSSPGEDDVCFCNGSSWLSLVDGSSCVFIN